MTQYIVACQYKDKDFIKQTSNNQRNLLRSIAFLRVEKWVWYDDDVYSPMIPSRIHWYKHMYPFWWDILEEKCPNKLQDAILRMNIIFKNETDDEEEYEEVIQWLSHWISKGAYFVLVHYSSTNT